MSWRLCVRADFSAAHYLRHYQGKCENLHGHNFAVEACIDGDALDAKTGMLIDFGLLKRVLRDVVAPLDHAVLNDIPPFDAESPSSENLARYIGQKMAGLLAPMPEAAHARVASVAVSEKAAQTAIWLNPDAEEFAGG